MIAAESSDRVRRPTSARTRRAAEVIGERLVTWRKLQGLTAQQVAERANVSRPTLRKLEHGDAGASMAAFLGVARALGQLDRLVDALDPYETDFGRAQADALLPKRVRR